MKVGKHTAFMIDFISDFVNGEIDRYFFDLDYSAYVIEHFPGMESENAGFADRFAGTIDLAYERGTDLNAYSGAAEPQFRGVVSHPSGTTEPPFRFKSH